jgi:urate oxidase
MAILLAQNDYGEARIRLYKIARQPDRHDFKDLTLGIQFEGDFEASYATGDNRGILPGDTIRNTVYALAKLYSIEQIEEFAQRLIDHFLADNRHLARVRVDIAENFWTRVPFGGKAHASSFTPAGPERRTAVVAGTRESVSIESGLDNLAIVKTGGAGFEGYRRDPFTTLEETNQRMLSTAVTASWLYADNEIPYGVYWHGVREAIVETMVEHESRSVQNTLHAVAEAVLERYADIVEIHLSVPNLHGELVDLTPFGLENNNEIFAPSDHPYELIRARVRRS